MEDPHLAAVSFFGTLDSGRGWDMRYVRNPLRLSQSHVAAAMPPRLGEHSADILKEIGLTPADVGNP